MDTKELQVIKDRAEKAEPGPWETYRDHIYSAYERYGIATENSWPIVKSSGDLTKIHADFIAHAREDIPALIGEVEQLRDWLKQAKGERDSLVGAVVYAIEAGVIDDASDIARIALNILAGL